MRATKEPTAPPAPAVDPNAEETAPNGETAPAVSAAETAPPNEADNLHKLLWNVWRTATDRETPTLNQLVQGGKVRRVDVDATSGYIAVVTEEDTHRAIGVRREWVAHLVATLTNRTPEAVAALLAKGPQKIPPEPVRPPARPE